MAEKSVKVDGDIHELVVKYSQTTGVKIGKFYDIAAQKELQRLSLPVSKWPIKKETK